MTEICISRHVMAVLLPMLALTKASVCVHGSHGPPCKKDADCIPPTASNCTRCAHSGFCTDVPLPPGPHPQPGPHPSAGGCTTDDHSYEYLVLVQGWPKSSCVDRSCPSSFTSKDYWTLHGLWPSRAGSQATSYPCQCDSRAFDESAISSFEQDLTKYWASFKSPMTGFWGHEWTKHGTCCSDNTQLAKQTDFFKKALELRSQHDLGDALKKANITPNDSTPYTGAQILAALKDASGVEPLLGCVTVSGKQYLHEVSFCLDKKTLADITCDSTLAHLPDDEVSNCELTKPMILAQPTSEERVVV